MLAVSKVRVMRVLLVEDDEFLGDGIRAGLKQYGHTIDWVRDGQAAHDVLSSTHETFDIIILDLGLPKRSGLDVLKTIREKNESHSCGYPNGSRYRRRSHQRARCRIRRLYD